MIIKCQVKLTPHSCGDALTIFYKPKGKLFSREITIFNTWHWNHEKDFITTVEEFLDDNPKERIIELIKMDIKSREEDKIYCTTEENRRKNIENKLKDLKFEFEI